jgi:uncharacterized protein (TIGR04222 family)
MNLFDLRGPEFLVFYFTLSIFVLIAAWLVQRLLEAGRPGDEAAWGRGVAKDPYQVACLRGGPDELIRVAIVSLMERGLLAADGDELRATVQDAADHARRPLDKAILTKCAASARAPSLFTDEVIGGEAAMVAATLEEKGLLLNQRIRALRAATVIVAVGLLWLVAGIKIAVALARGRHNILFLILMAAVAAVVGMLLTKRRRTALGDRTLAYLRETFAGLGSRRDSLQMNGKTGEIAFLAAAFGMAALPAALTLVLKPLDLRPPKPQHSGWGSCGSSSCGGGGGGGGCGGGGGGGCGGGCGGCGG